jgi:hypothetical protein
MSHTTKLRHTSQAEWVRLVDAAVIKKTGLGIDELVGDWPEASYYEDGLTPARAANLIIEESGFNDFEF